MAHMEMQIFKKGALYSADCAKCGGTNYTHEWAHIDHNARRDAMQTGALFCEWCCMGRTDPKTFHDCGRQYAGWYSAPGYLDCTSLEFDTNRRRLERTLRDLYGE